MFSPRSFQILDRRSWIGTTNVTHRVFFVFRFVSPRGCCFLDNVLTFSLEMSYLVFLKLLLPKTSHLPLFCGIATRTKTYSVNLVFKDNIFAMQTNLSFSGVPSFCLHHVLCFMTFRLCFFGEQKIGAGGGMAWCVTLVPQRDP